MQGTFIIIEVLEITWEKATANWQIMIQVPVNFYDTVMF